MSKKDKIVEMLKKDTNTEDICTELGVSTSYVYRIKREMDELEGDTGDTDETENDTFDGVVVDSTGGSGVDVEGNDEDVEKKEENRKTDKNKRLGGVKKRKKRTKKTKKDTKSEQNEQDEQDERTGGVLQWIKTQWKKTLLILTFLILLVMVMLSSSLTTSPEMTQDMQVNQSRYPILTH